MANRKKDFLTRSYDYRLPREAQTDCLRTLDFLLPVENNLIEKLWSEGFLKQLKNCDTKQVWKWLEPQLKRPKNVPSRIWRGVLEQIGRVLRTQANKQDLFYFLKGITTDESQWCWQLCRDNGRRLVRANYIYSLKEAVERYKTINDNKFPENYFDFTRCPKLKNGILTYAPDDGQAIRSELEGSTYKTELKLLDENDKWVWKETSFELPPIVLQRLNEENGCMKSPDLRRKNGKVFLDLKVETKTASTAENACNKVFVDWGTTRKLLVMLVVTPDGVQLGPPIFLKYEPIFRKLHRTRQHIDHLRKARKKIARRKDRRRWDNYTVLIKQAWAKYHELQKELAHLASNVLVDIAEAYDCNEIYVEDLSTLKATRFGRWLNRVINNTVRSQIYNKVQYKGNLKGIKLHYVRAWHTSVTCPLTGVRGKRYLAPDKDPREGGGWFISDSFSADADYVACKNLARRVLFDFKLSCPKALAYKERATLGKQFGRGMEGLRNLQRSLSGWTSGAVVVPLSLQHPLRAGVEDVGESVHKSIRLTNGSRGIIE
ncbi:MAG: transposase [Actinomycetia bacterium]|nr:transposase [Actinomycetes bacterium]